MKKVFFAEILRPKDVSKRISTLAWKTHRVQVETSGAGVNTQVFIRPIGKVTDPHAGLLYKGLKVVTNAAGLFRFKIPIWGETSEVTMSTVTPEGEIREETMVIRFPNWKEFQQDFVTKKLNFNISMGVFYMRYQGTFTSENILNITDRNRDITQFGIAPKVSAFYLLIPGVLDIGTNAFITALPLGASPAENAFRTFGFNWRMGWVVPFVDRPWRFSLMAGWYFLTMLSSAGDGYSNVAGPQLFPLIHHYLSSGSVLSAYFKFSPISKNIGLLKLTNREIAAGLGLVKPIGKTGNVLTINLDFAQVDLTLDETDTDTNEAFSVAHRTTTLGLSVGYGF